MEDPRIVVRFLTDANHEPIYVQRGKFQHYQVEIEAVGLPADAYAVQFELDESYYDPVRTVTPDSEGRFRFTTTTYGDFPVIARVMRTKGDKLTLKTGLTRALRDTIGESAALREANNYIAVH